MKRNNTSTKKAYGIYLSSCNPPTFEDFVNIAELLAIHDNVLVSPLLKYEDKWYRKAASYGTRVEAMRIFMEDFFPKIGDRLMLVDIKKEMHLSRPRATINEVFAFINQKLEGQAEYYLNFESEDEKSELYGEQKATQVVNLSISNENIKEHVRKFLATHEHLKTEEKQELSLMVGDKLCDFLSKNKIYYMPKKILKIKP